MVMDTTLRKEIMSFLTPLTCMQSEESRRAALYAAGLDAVSSQTNLSGSSTNAVAAIVQGLEQYGTVGGTPALVVFLRYVATTVGSDRQKLIQRFCQRLQHETKNQPTSQQAHSQPADTSTTTHINTQRDYFEHVGGQAQVFTGPVNIYQGAPPHTSQGSSPKEPATVKNRTGQEKPAPVQEESAKKWDVFISHASEDKEQIARPLAEALQHAGLRVWYDEFSLTLGDSLRRSIDQGLRDSRFGLVILSPNFFAKEWPQRELDGLTAREIQGGKVILPVWHNVSHQDVLQFSPVLADKLAVSTGQGLERVVRQILQLFS